jgi:hypothetical protein
VRIAVASIGETMNHVRYAWKRKYVNDEEHRDLVVLAKRAYGASTAWLAYLDSCPPDGPKRQTRKRNERLKQSNLENQEPDPEP